MKQVKKWAPKILTSIAVFILGWSIFRSGLLFLKYMHTLIFFPFNVDYGEGPILSQVMNLASFQNIYHHNTNLFPYTISNYPPLYHLLQLPFAWIFGPAFWYGRIINLISLITTAILIGLVIYHFTKDWLAAMTGGGLLLTIPYIMYFGGFVRVDSLALVVSWAGLYIIVCWHKHSKGIIFAAVLLTGAVFTRQSYGLAAPFAAFIWLLSQKPRWRAFELALWTGGLSLIVFFFLNIVSNGGFYFNIITANINPFIWETVRYYWTEVKTHMPYLLIMCAFYILITARLHQKAWRLATPYFLASTISAITIGKDGSNVNYLFEFSSALALLCGLVVAIPGIAWKGFQWIGKGWWLKALIMLGLAWQINHIYYWNLREYYQWTTNRIISEQKDIELIVKMIQASDGLVLADEYMGLLPLAGKSLIFQPFEYKQLAINNKWDEKPFIQAIENKKFDLILLYDPDGWDALNARWTPNQLLAIEKNYILVDQLAQTQILVPR